MKACVDEYGTAASHLFSAFLSYASSAAEFYGHQLLWDREHHTTTQADRQFWERDA